MTTPLTRAELVAEYNHMAQALGHRTVKDFKSKELAQARIAQLRPDYDAYMEDFERKDEQPDPKRGCGNADCGWEGPQSETVEMKHGSPSHLCPRCHEVTELLHPAASETKSLVEQFNEGAGIVSEQVCIVLHNNDNTAQWHVAEILEKALGIAGPYEDEDSDAHKLMYKAHTEGRAVCGTYPKIEAESRMQQVESEKERLGASGQYRSEYVKELKFTIEPAEAKVAE